jgi:hypothetical protein
MDIVDKMGNRVKRQGVIGDFGSVNFAVIRKAERYPLDCK